MKGACDSFAGPQGDCHPPSAFSWELAGAKLLYLGLEIPIVFALLMFVERQLSPARRTTKDGDDDPEMLREEDPDVLAEQKRVQRGGVGQDGVAIQGLRKVYHPGSGKPHKVAVRDLWLGADAGECLGLLGPNGMG